MNEEELDPYEKEVKRATDEYNKRLKQKDTYESGLKKAKEEETKRIEDEKVEEEEGGFLDEGSAFRTTAAIGTEIAANTLLDLFSFIPPAQYAGGAAINYFAQRIRGGEFDQGEMIASGLASLLPGGAQAKSLKGVIGKGIAKGALSGAIETGAADLINTGELDSERLGQGALIGGAFGGIFSHIGSQKKVQRGIKYFQDRIKGEKFVKLSPEDALELGIGEPFMSVLDEGPYTQKFDKQPWELYQSSNPTLARGQDRLLTQTTGFGAKLNAPQPKGQSYNLLRSKGRGRPALSMVKDDIKLDADHGFRFNTPEQAVSSAKKFRREIIRLMQIDRIRGEDAGTRPGFLKTSSKVNTVAGGVKDISETYFDYLTGYFNRYIRRGTVDNFEDAVKLEIPKVRGGEVFPDEIDTIQGSSSLIRELRLFTIAPDVYKSGAFTTRNPTYQAKLRNLMRKYSTAEKPRTYNARRDTFEYRFDAHHIDQIAEGWPLYRGLPKAEIPKMRQLVKDFGLKPGNDEGNMLLILNEFHKDYHNIYWPKAYAKLLEQGWDPDAMRTIDTAAGRKRFVEMYVNAINESREEVEEAVRANIDELLEIIRQRRIGSAKGQIEQIDIDFENVGDEVPPEILADMQQDAGINDTTRWRNYQQAADYE